MDNHLSPGSHPGRMTAELLFSQPQPVPVGERALSCTVETEHPLPYRIATDSLTSQGRTPHDALLGLPLDMRQLIQNHLGPLAITQNHAS